VVGEIADIAGELELANGLLEEEEEVGKEVGKEAVGKEAEVEAVNELSTRLSPSANGLSLMILLFVLALALAAIAKGAIEVESWPPKGLEGVGMFELVPKPNDGGTGVIVVVEPKGAGVAKVVSDDPNTTTGSGAEEPNETEVVEEPNKDPPNTLLLLLLLSLFIL